jgi:hypothetical protein
MSDTIALTLWELPTSGTPQQYTITLAGNTWLFVFRYRDADMGGWILDIYDSMGNPVLCGAPLVTGHDILEQYEYLGFGGAMMVLTDGDPSAVPTFDNLGTNAHLYWISVAPGP